MRLSKLVMAGFTIMIAAGAAIAYPPSGPEGEFKSLFGKLEYDPSRSCTKPIKPYSEDAYARQSYLNDAKRYLECLKEAANADVKYATQVIQAGHEEATNDFFREFRRGF